MKLSKEIQTLVTVFVLLGSLLLLSSGLDGLFFNRLLVCSLIVTGVFLIRALGTASRSTSNSPMRMNPPHKTARGHE